MLKLCSNNFTNTNLRVFHCFPLNKVMMKATNVSCDVSCCINAEHSPPVPLRVSAENCGAEAGKLGDRSEF